VPVAVFYERVRTTCCVQQPQPWPWLEHGSRCAAEYVRPTTDTHTSDLSKEGGGSLDVTPPQTRDWLQVEVTSSQLFV